MYEYSFLQKLCSVHFTTVLEQRDFLAESQREAAHIKDIVAAICRFVVYPEPSLFCGHYPTVLAVVGCVDAIYVDCFPDLIDAVYRCYVARAKPVALAKCFPWRNGFDCRLPVLRKSKAPVVHDRAIFIWPYIIAI